MDVHGKQKIEIAEAIRDGIKSALRDLKIKEIDFIQDGYRFHHNGYKYDVLIKQKRE